MDFNKYQDKTSKTAKYPEDQAFSYLALGVTGEAGEVAEKVKKHIRDDADIDKVKDELGDVLWYLARLADELDVELNQVAEENLEKLIDRKERGKISGSGDNR